MHTSCFGEPRIPSAKTPLDIGTPIGPKQLRSAPMAFNKMSSEELRLAKLWYDEDGKTPLEILQLLRRDKSTITRHVVKRTRQKRLGRPRALTDSEEFCSLSASRLGTVRDRVGTGLGAVGKIGGTVGTARWGG